MDHLGMAIMPEIQEQANTCNVQSDSQDSRPV